MAENGRPIRQNIIGCSFQDGTGTPLTYTPLQMIKGTVTWMPRMPRDKATLLYQQSGAAGIYDIVDTGVKDALEVKLDIWYTDPKNATDKTMARLMECLYINSFASSGFSSWVSTNPLPGGSHITADMKITLYSYGGVGVNNVATAPVYVHDLPSLSVENMVLKLSCTLKAVAEWTWT